MSCYYCSSSPSRDAPRPTPHAPCPTGGRLRGPRIGNAPRHPPLERTRRRGARGSSLGCSRARGGGQPLTLLAAGNSEARGPQHLILVIRLSTSRPESDSTAPNRSEAGPSGVRSPFSLAKYQKCHSNDGVRTLESSPTNVSRLSSALFLFYDSVKVSKRVPSALHRVKYCEARLHLVFSPGGGSDHADLRQLRHAAQGPDPRRGVRLLRAVPGVVLCRSRDQGVAAGSGDEGKGGWTCTDSWVAHQGPVWKLQWAHPQYGRIIASPALSTALSLYGKSSTTFQTRPPPRPRLRPAKAEALVPRRHPMPLASPIGNCAPAGTARACH